jgi:nucleoside-diphosphate-sugar epimerase
MQAIHVDDVVQQMLLQATQPAAVGEAFNATPDPPVSWREFFRHYAELNGKQRWLALPPVLGDIAAPLIDVALRLRNDPYDTAAAIRFLQRWTLYSMDKSRRLLDWEPQVDLARGIESCIPWLREEGLLK